ncbi:MAG: RelA/SpoT domain-containing protein [Oceanococcus sp.]
MTKTYSGKQIGKAGEVLRCGKFNDGDEQLSLAMDVLSYWRLCHEKPLEVAFRKVQNVAKKRDKNALFAKRLKRYVSISRKLQRFDRMSLKNMQDIGGCRVIVATEKKLEQVVRDLRKLPEFKTSSGTVRSKDYVSNPKPDGYRSYHLIGKFSDGKIPARNIEVQIRTRIQHYWATALEIVDLFTNQALKSNQGDEDWKAFFVNVSRQFHLMESVHLFDQMDLSQKFRAYCTALHQKRGIYLASCSEAQHYYKSLRVFDKLRAYAESLKVIEQGLREFKGSGYALLAVDTIKGELKWTLFGSDNNQEAEDAYIKAEKLALEQPGMVVALVSASAAGGIREAYPNFFADSKMFINHLVLIEKAPLDIRPNMLERALAGAGFDREGS